MHGVALRQTDGHANYCLVLLGKLYALLMNFQSWKPSNLQKSYRCLKDGQILPPSHLTNLPPTCHLHVLVSVQHDADRTPEVVAGHRDGRVQEYPPSLLPSETTTQTLCLGHNLVRRDTKDTCNVLLVFCHGLG